MDTRETARIDLYLPAWPASLDLRRRRTLNEGDTATVAAKGAL